MAREPSMSHPHAKRGGISLKQAFRQVEAKLPKDVLIAQSEEVLLDNPDLIFKYTDDISPPSSRRASLIEIESGTGFVDFPTSTEPRVRRNSETPEEWKTSPKPFGNLTHLYRDVGK